MDNTPTIIMSTTEKTLQERLTSIQQSLKVPKNNKNSFGGYNYRSCEDILEAVKPLLDECSLVISDEIVYIGTRYYVKATIKLTLGQESIQVTAYAREPEVKKGMDEAQITGSASSYARKYALNGLFAIDDTKDADYQESREDVETAGEEGVSAEAGERVCPVHHKPMKQRIGRNGGSWYDHRWLVNGVWQQCNGRPKGETEGNGMLANGRN